MWSKPKAKERAIPLEIGEQKQFVENPLETLARHLSVVWLVLACVYVILCVHIHLVDFFAELLREKLIEGL